MVAERRPALDGQPGRAWSEETLVCEAIRKDGRRCTVFGRLTAIREDGRRLCTYHWQHVRILRRTTCGKGHPKTPENTYTKQSGKQECRPCTIARYEARRNREARSRAALREAIAQRQAGAAERPILPSKPQNRPQVRPTAEIVSEALESVKEPLSVFERIALGHARLKATPREVRGDFVGIVNAGCQEAEKRARPARHVPAGSPRPTVILTAAADVCEVPPADLPGRSRLPDIVRARQLACYLIRQLCPGMSLVDIGRLLGGRDHATVIYSIEKITRLVAAGDRETLRDLDLVREALGETES